nr:MAG TPA_asm: terminase small subunit [Caudoviricetes sp.]
MPITACSYQKGQHKLLLSTTSQALLSVGTQLAVLSEVLNGTNHLRGVGVLVVVPGHDLNLIGVVVELSDHGLGSVEQRAVTHADDIGRNDRILVVAEGLRGSSLHSSIDGLLGDILALDNGNQDGGRTGGNGHTLSRADQLAVQLGDDQADGLSSTGAVGDDGLFPTLFDIFKKGEAMKREKWIETIEKQMEKLGTADPSYQSAVETLAEILEQRDKTKAEFKKSGGKSVIEYTNKGNATNMVKNPLLILWDDLNKSALAYWRELGLTPSSFRKMTGGVKEKEEKGGLAAALASLETD